MYQSLSECNCNQAMNGLSDLTDKEVQKITTDHFKNKNVVELASITYQMGRGDFTGISNEVRAVAEKICTAGANDKITQFLTNPMTIGGVLLGVGLIYYASSK